MFFKGLVSMDKVTHHINNKYIFKQKQIVNHIKVLSKKV